MSLYQECRPQSLNDIIGNVATVGALNKMLKQSVTNRPHAILLKGPSGCGKTTIARILAKEFGSVDETIIELNAANTRGIDTIREISSSLSLSGLGGKVKTYILDESQAITTIAQEALLKSIEDCPQHCYFVLCTTSPDNIIKTVRNRCSEYEVNTLTNSQIKELLTKVCQKKELKVSEDVLEGIVQTCEGSPRAAIVSLEQIIGIDDVNDAFEILVKGTVADGNVIDFMKMMMWSPEIRKQRWKQIIDKFNSLTDDNEKLRRSMLTFLYNNLKKLKDTDVEIAVDIAKLMEIFSVSTFYGGKSALAVLVVKAVLGD
jgi:DNA polymerase-3 subunit gamma/tau